MKSEKPVHPHPYIYIYASIHTDTQRHVQKVNKYRKNVQYRAGATVLLEKCFLVIGGHKSNLVSFQNSLNKQCMGKPACNLTLGRQRQADSFTYGWSANLVRDHAQEKGAWMVLRKNTCSRPLPIAKMHIRNPKRFIPSTTWEIRLTSAVRILLLSTAGKA